MGVVYSMSFIVAALMEDSVAVCFTSYFTASAATVTVNVAVVVAATVAGNMAP
jgi:hypothetical protein